MTNKVVDQNNQPQEDIKSLLADQVLMDLMNERKSERRWKWIKRFTFSTIGALLFAVYLAFYASSLGYRLIPNAEIVGVVNVSGSIGSGQLASAEELVPVLEKAFNSPKVKAIALNIDSPGGQPFESERVGQTIDRLKSETGKPVYAFIGNTGASAAYLLALHADKIVAGRYSLVGSIGAVITGWDLHKLAEKFDVTQRFYASGVHKNMLNPFVVMSKESEAKAQEMVNQMAVVFADEFKSKRGAKLKEGFDYTTGEIWGGEEALAIGLIDEIGTIEGVVSNEWHAKTHDFGPTNQAKGFLSQLGTKAVEKVLALVE
ncbi:S49 family peptidase [Methylobacter sp. BBA5.1]|jgi:protease IV|uniref:S49 family peptidase n=1 Tax=Methylobacter sp. BBA5.1 TaxID=1495064 RepID=UPI000565EC8B|nr:S49 family peptidase [Methylobacter sp. BBA5.1]